MICEARVLQFIILVGFGDNSLKAQFQVIMHTCYHTKQTRHKQGEYSYWNYTHYQAETWRAGCQSKLPDLATSGTYVGAKHACSKPAVVPESQAQAASTLHPSRIPGMSICYVRLAGGRLMPTVGLRVMLRFRPPVRSDAMAYTAPVLAHAAAAGAASSHQSVSQFIHYLSVQTHLSTSPIDRYAALQTRHVSVTLTLNVSCQ